MKAFQILLLVLLISNLNAQSNPVGFTDMTSLLSGPNFSGVAVGVADMNGDNKMILSDLIRLDHLTSIFKMQPM